MVIYTAISQAAMHTSIPLDLVLSQDSLHIQTRVQKKGGFTFLGKKWAGRNRKFGIIYAQTLIAHF